MQTLAFIIYTFVVIQHKGTDVFTPFLSNITSLNWNGQFNVDFMCYLLLSGLWIMWRNKFSVTSILLGMASMIIGTGIFAPYLLYLLAREKGNLVTVLTGNR